MGPRLREDDDAQKSARKKTGAPIRMRVGLLRLLTGVPKGIRTPVLTVKG